MKRHTGPKTGTTCRSSTKTDSKKTREKPDTPQEPRTKHKNTILRSTTGEKPHSPGGPLEDPGGPPRTKKTAAQILINF